MWYVSIVAVLGILSYIFLVGKIEMIVPPKNREQDTYAVTQSS
jgi:ACS family D-galactonate transporter-like MFS transporter